MKLKKFDKVEVEWLDSNHESGWKKESYYEGDKAEGGLEHRTCGYFLNYTKRAANFVLSRSLNKFDDEYVVDSMMQIPKRAIIKIKKLK